MKKESSQHFVREFLFNASDITQDGPSIKAILRMDENKEGWMGIPHGGIGMGAVMDLAAALPGYPAGKEALYPLTVEFRMGGSSVKVGDSLEMTVSEAKGGAQGIIVGSDETFPYLSAAISYTKDDPERRQLIAAYLPEAFSDMEKSLAELPYYKNCFVCGVDRSAPGLKRRFTVGRDRSGEKYLTLATAGLGPDDADTFGRFQQNGMIHPMAPMAVLDETMGWAGFLASASGAVTVFISYTFYRPILAGEKLVFFGRVERVRGRPRARVMFWASGGAAAIDKQGRLELVIASQGQWMGVPELTDQMHRELIPPDAVDRALEMASTRKG